MPRRTMMMEATYGAEPWELAGIITGIGGSLMLLGAALFFLVLGMTILFSRRTEVAPMPFAETLKAPATTGWEVGLDKFRYWIAVTIILILIAYGPFLLQYLPPKLTSPGYTLF